MTKKQRSGQQLKKPQFDFKVTETIHEETDSSELETEIECPSCQRIIAPITAICAFTCSVHPNLQTITEQT